MRKIPMLILTACLTLCLGACSTSVKDTQPCKITFERGSGSTWGNQFYVEVCQTEVILVRYILVDSMDLVTQEHIPISPETWQALTDTITALQLQQKQTSFLSHFGTNNKLDGGEYKNLTVQYGSKEVSYQWPTDPEAAELEKLLESLVDMQGVSPTA